MPGSKYEREIRFMGKEVVRLSTLIDTLEAKGSDMSPEDRSKVEEYKAQIDQYLARKKEIEDSYIEAGLELPLESRNLNASVYRNGSSFEPETNSYKMRVMEEARELMSELNLLSDNISNIERQIIEADLADELGEKARLEEKLSVLRAHREDVFYRIKELRARAAGQKDQEQEIQSKDSARIDSLERDISSLRNQTSMIRNDMSDMKEALRLIMEKLNIENDDY